MLFTFEITRPSMETINATLQIAYLWYRTRLGAWRLSTSVADTTIALQCMILSFVAPPHIKETINATRAIDFAILLFVYAIYCWCFEVRPLCWRTSHGENCRRASHIDVFESCVYCFRRGLPFQDKESFSKLATKTTPKQEIWLPGQIYAGPLLVYDVAISNV